MVTIKCNGNVFKTTICLDDGRLMRKAGMERRRAPPLE